MGILSYSQKGKDRFEMICRQTFSFLRKDFGCKPPVVERDGYGTYIAYVNETTAVEISFVPRDGYIFIGLVRLVDGEIPPYPIYIKPKIILHLFSLIDIVAIRNPAKVPEIPSISEWDDCVVVRKDLLLRSKLLRKYASDVLRGDFSIFPKLDKIVKKRAAAYAKIKTIEGALKLWE